MPSQCKMFYFALLLFPTFSTTLATVDVVVVGDNNALCMGMSVTLQCTLMGGVLTWYTPEGALNFVRGRQASDTVSYHGQLIEPNDTHLISTLNFTFTTEITINCSDTSSSAGTTIIIEGPPSAPDRPLTALDRIRRLNKTVSSVSVVWNIPDTNNAHISSYVVTVDPPIPLPASGVIAADNPVFQSRQLTLTLLHGQQYYITVTARSCGDSVEGPASSALRVNVPRPPKVVRCTAVPVYDYYSNNLKRIEIEWYPFEEAEENVTVNISVAVVSYTISTVPLGVESSGINVTIEASDHSSCASTSCKYFVKNLTVMSAPTYTIIITANDLLSDGYTEIMACTDGPISIINNLTPIDTKSIFTAAVNTLSQPLLKFRESVGETEETAVVFLTTTTAPEAALTVVAQGGKQDVVVEGSFEPASLSTNIYHTPIACPATPPISVAPAPPAPIAVVAVAISVCPALCIINCLIGALLHHVLVSRSCYRKKQTATDQPQHLYDEVTLRDTGTENPGSDPSGNRMCDETIVTLQNQAYSTASV